MVIERNANTDKRSCMASRNAKRVHDECYQTIENARSTINSFSGRTKAGPSSETKLPTFNQLIAPKRTGYPYLRKNFANQRGVSYNAYELIYRKD